MGKKVLYGPITFGRNHSYPSTSITKKVAKMEEFPLVHKLIILLKTRSFFFRKSHNRWKAFAHLAKLKCLMHCGRTFQAEGNTDIKFRRSSIFLERRKTVGNVLDRWYRAVVFGFQPLDKIGSFLSWEKRELMNFISSREFWTASHFHRGKLKK